jgi:DNA-binding MarR family transcriptional regulator
MKTTHVIGLISKIRSKVNRLIICELEKNGLKGIAPSHGSIFAELYRSGDLSMNQIAASIYKDKSTVTALIDKLEARGYVKRCDHGSCNRTTVIRLTEKGKKFEPVFDEISKKLLNTIYKGFT